MAFLILDFRASVFSLYVAILSSRDSRRPDCSPDSTRLQNRSSKYWGCFASEAARVLPAATSVLISFINLAKFGFEVPSAMISKDCTMGTPELIMVASWRVKNAISRGVIFLARPPKNVDFLWIFVTRTPCLRRWALTRAWLVPWISPATLLPDRSLPSHLNG